MRKMINNSYILFYYSFVIMTKLNVFAAFAVLFLSSVLLANGMYSNKIFAIEAQNENNHDQNGNLNEAEINADIEQENKCKKDTECENENEINNQLSITNITTITQEQEEQPETPTCETCFTDNLSEEAVNFIEDTFFTQEPSSLQEICDFIDENIEGIALPSSLAFYLYEDVLNNTDATEEDIDNVVDCLEEVFGVDIPRPPFT